MYILGKQGKPQIVLLKEHLNSHACTPHPSPTIIPHIVTATQLSRLHHCMHGGQYRVPVHLVKDIAVGGVRWVTARDQLLGQYVGKDR